LNIDLDVQKQRAALLAKHFSDAFAQTIQTALTKEWQEATNDVDGSLYSGGFFGQEDKDRFEQIRTSSPSKLRDIGGYFKDPRCEAMLFRYRARNFPETLDQLEREDWQAHKKDRLHNDHAPWLSASEFAQIMNEIDWPEAEESLRVSLANYAKQILAEQ